MRMRGLRIALACLLSTGWIAPLWCAAHEWMRYVRLAFPLRYEAVQPEGFPHAQAVDWLLSIGAIWLAIAICFWVALALRRR
jgi:hypothetical protein